MAFLTSATPLPHARIARSRAHLCRMNGTDSGAATAGTAINAEKALEMKEIYKLAAGSKTAVCRCWQSANFPICDGSHNAYNKATGSHVGPLVVSAAKANN